MFNDLFKVDLPIIKTKEEHEALKKLFPKLDLYYLTTGCLKARRERFEKMYNRVEKKGLIDENFSIEAQIQGKFHSRTWEMFIACLFLDNKFRCSKFSKRKGGPDLIIKDLKGIELAYLECVAPKDGIGQNSVPKYLIPKEPQIMPDPPYQDLILRLANSIDNKIDQYNESWAGKLTSFNTNLPYILAINFGDPDLSCWKNIDENIIHSLLFNAKIFDEGRIAYSRNGKIIKFPKLNTFLNKKSEPIPTNYFLSEKHNFISAVIFSKEDVLNQSLIIENSNIIIFNPFAKNKLSPTLFNFMRQFRFVSQEKNLVILEETDISNTN